jgi:hypothetical protein
MKTNLSIFAQVIGLSPRDIIHKNVDEHDSDFNSKGINAWTHLVSILYCQFGNCQSIRDISFGLRSATGNLNHLGSRGGLVFKAKAPSFFIVQVKINLTSSRRLPYL